MTYKSMKQVPGERFRIDWVDKAKAYGMYFVFYGHFVEKLYDTGSDPALVQQKLIYSFHMPLFILLSGFFAKTEMPPLRTFLKRQAASRLLPVLFFSVLMLPIFFVADIIPRVYLTPAKLSSRFISNWPELCQRINLPAEEKEVHRHKEILELLPIKVRKLIAQGAAGTQLGTVEKELIINKLNALLQRRDFFEHVNLSNCGLPEVLLKMHKNRAVLSQKKIRWLNFLLIKWALFPERFPVLQPPWSWSDWLWRAKMTLRGYPMFNVPVWFLVCLFTIELIHYGCLRFLYNVPRIALAIPIFFAVGWFVTARTGLWQDFWFVRESLFLYSFYLLGFLLSRSSVFQDRLKSRHGALLFTVSVVVLLFTFDLNFKAPGFTSLYTPVVIVMMSQHGNPLCFAISALAGCLAVIGLARVTPSCMMLSHVGRYSLTLMGLNGFFFTLFNQLVVAFMDIPPEPIRIVFWCTVISLVSMVFCLPVAWLLDRYLPQITGKPQRRGPLLPNLV